MHLSLSLHGRVSIKLSKKFFERFDVIIGDEAHLYKAKSLSGILNKCHDAKYRVD